MHESTKWCYSSYLHEMKFLCWQVYPWCYGCCVWCFERYGTISCIKEEALWWWGCWTIKESVCSFDYKRNIEGKARSTCWAGELSTCMELGFVETYPMNGFWNDLFTYICRWTMRWHWSMLHRVEWVKNPEKLCIYSHWKLKISSLTFVVPSLFLDSSSSNFLLFLTFILIL